MTWIFESKSVEQESILVCVSAESLIAAWQEASSILYAAGHTPWKRDGHFGFLTKRWREQSSNDPVVGIIDSNILKKYDEGKKHGE